MSCELYIGNFPSSLTSEDLIVLFQDFDGIEFLRIIKKEKKCFAFFRCVDQDQAAYVAMTMNGIDVCGRNLIVRSSDDKLQAKIEKGPQNSNQIEKQFADLSLSQPRGLQNAGSQYYHDPQSDHQNFGRKPNPNGQSRDPGSEYSYNNHSRGQNNSWKSNPNGQPRVSHHVGSDHYASLQSNSQKRNWSQPRGAMMADSGYSFDNPSGIQNYGCKPNPNSQPRGAQDAGSEFTYDNPSGFQYGSQKPNSNYMPLCRGAKVKQNVYSGNSEKNYGNHDYSIGYYDEKHEHNDSKSSHPGYGCSGEVETHYQGEAEADADEISKDELFFVSVVNFPLGTTMRELYELFSDYNPFKVFVVCNYPRPDKLPTEAIVSFISQSDATDVILNFDNTVYRNRVLLVTDAADTSIVPELLSLC